MNKKFFNFERSSFVLIATFLVCGFFIANNILAAAIVNLQSATGGEAISADTNSGNGTGAWTTLTGPVISETASGEIKLGDDSDSNSVADNKIVFSIPSGFQFNTASPIIMTITDTGGTGQSDYLGGLASGSTITASVTSLQITVIFPAPLTKTANGALATLTFSGIQIRPTTSTLSSIKMTQTTGHDGVAMTGIAKGLSGTSLATIAEVPGAFSATSTISANPTSVKADGTSLSTITVTAKDQFSNPIQNKAVVLSSTGSNNTFVQPPVTDSSGVAVGTLTSTKAEQKIVSASVDGTLLTHQATINFNAVLPVTITPATLVGGGQISLSADTNPNNGGSGTFTAITGPTITEGSSGGIGAGTIILNAPAGFKFKSSGAPVTVLVTDINNGDLNVSDYLGGVASGTQLTATVNGNGTQITVNIASPTVNGVVGAITFQGILLRPAEGTPLANSNFVLSASQTSVIFGITPLVTSLGAATETVGALSYSASTISANPTSVAADGTSSSTITATVTDLFGNPIQGKTVYLLANGVAFQTATTDSSGVAVGTLTSTKAEQKIITASIDGQNLTHQTTITFNPGGSVSAKITASPRTFSDDSYTTLAINTYDANGNLIMTGPAVSVQSDLGTVSNCTDISGGQETCKFASTKVGTANLSVIGLQTSGDTSISVIPGITTQIALTANPSSLPFTDSSQIQVTAEDINGNINTNDSATKIILSSDGTLADSLLTVANGIVTTTLSKNTWGTAHVAATSGSLIPVSITVVFTKTDTNPPVLSAHADAVVEATSAAGADANYYPLPTASDDKDGSISNVSCKPASGGNFPIGSTVITCSAKDSQDNVGMSTFNVIVHDTTPPVITLPANITTEATGPQTSIADLGQASATDLVDPKPTITNNAPATFPVGATNAIWTATDATGNKSTATQIITITDKTPPEITSPADQQFELTGALTSPQLVSATATDLADANPKITYNPTSFPLGDTTVTWTATDASGNTATSTSKVTIVDTVAPSGYSVVIDQPHINDSNKTGLSFTFSNAEVGDTYSYSINGDAPVEAQDKISSARQNISGIDASSVADGTLTLSVVLSDEAGNKGDPATATVSKDTVLPVIASHADMNDIEATSVQGVAVNYDLPTALDDVDGDVSASVSCLPVSGSYFNFGTNTVSCSVQDKAGNTGTSSFAINVVSKTLPTITAPADITVSTQGIKTLVADLGTPVVSDIADPNPQINNDAPKNKMFPLGDTIITWRVTDSFGNTATAQQKITIVPGPVSQIVLNSSTNSTTDQSNQITITGKDSFGNVAINDSQTQVDLFSDGDSSLDNLTVTLAAGVATVNLSDKTPETVLVRASSNGIPSVQISVLFTQTDTTSPYVTDISPQNGSDTVQPTSAIILYFSEPLDSSTVSSDNIQLRRVDDDSAVPAVVYPAEGNRQAIIQPNLPLDFDTQYYFAVSSNVKDLAGNSLGPILDSSTENNYSFTTVIDTTVLSVTQIALTKSSAIADDNFDDGWQWVFNVTVPTDQTQLSMSFNDWTNINNVDTIPATDNVRFYSEQSDTNSTKDQAIRVMASQQQSDSTDLSADLDPLTPGRQIKIYVDAKIPTDATPGAYFTNYSIQSSAPPPCGLKICHVPPLH